MLLLLAAALAPVFAAETPAIVPMPAQMQVKACSFELNSRTAVVADKRLGDVARQLQLALAPATGFRLPIVEKAGSNAIEVRLVSSPKLGPEGYRLDVKAKRVTILANKPAGAFYALQTLRQMLPEDIFRQAPVDGGVWKAPCAAIQDAPRFAWRGALIDVSRHFMPKETLFKFIDVMALYKLNTLHLHLTDDHGWRIEIKRYPRLTEVAAAYDMSSVAGPDHATRSPSEPAGGFYTQDDIREIVKYASARHVTIVPEIEMPGHSGAAVMAYPELGNGGAWDNVLNVEDSTLAFVKNVLDEVMELFPSSFIHVGGDEVSKDPWKNNPRAQQRMKELGLKSEEELQSWFIKQMDAYLASKGRRLAGWDEILEGGLAPGATVTSWRGIEGGTTAAKSGHDVVMNPSSDTYLDYYQSKVTSLEPKAIGNYLPLERVYAYEPVPSELTPEQAKHILGAQASVWTEYVPSAKHLEYMAFPRLLAFSEVVWSPKDSRDWAGLRERLDFHFKKLDRLDVNYRVPRPDPQPAARWKAGELGAQWADKEWDVTPAVAGPGRYKIAFQFAGDNERLEVQSVEVLEDGRSLFKSDQPERSGGVYNETWKNVFTAVLRTQPAGKYTLRARVRADKPAQSAGEVYVVLQPPPARALPVLPGGARAGLERP